MAFLAIPIVGGFTVGMALQVAVVLYGAYRAKRQRSKAKKKAEDSLKDQTTTMPSTAVARTVNYGTTLVDGRVVLIVPATDAQPNYFIVKAFTPDHEIEGFVEILIDGVPVGPLLGDMYSDAGAWVTTGSKFYRAIDHTETQRGTIPDSGVIQCKGPVKQITGMVVNASGGEIPPNDPLSPWPTAGDGELAADYGNIREGVPLPPLNAGIQGSTVVVPPEYRGRGYQMTYIWVEERRHVRVWARRGSENQTAIPRLTEVKPAWTANHRGRGVPYVALEFVPDLDVFTDAPDDITAIIKGKRITDIRYGSVGFQNNAALVAYDYLRSEIECDADEIDTTLAIAAVNACDEQTDVLVGNTGIVTKELRKERRYSCDVELSTEEDAIENFRIILASMAGSAVYSGTTVDLRAGVAQAAVGELTDDDLASGDWSVRPYTPALDGFNSVRGVYTKFDESNKSLTVTDTPPYSSTFYVSQDDGKVAWEEINLPAVQSLYQAQRIQKLQLHLSRNGLSFQGKFKMHARQFRPGEVIYYTHTSLGFDAKPFLIREMTLADGNATVEIDMVEMPADVYSWDYREGVGPDPAPNTILPDPSVVAQITGLKAESGPGVARYGTNGEVRPVIRVTWDLSDDLNVLHSGEIDIWWKGSRGTEFQKDRVPGSSTRYDIETVRGAQVHIQVRARNKAQFSSKWTAISHDADNAVTGHLGGQLLKNPQFFYDEDKPQTNTRTSPPGWTRPLRQDSADAETVDAGALYIESNSTALFFESGLWFINGNTNPLNVDGLVTRSFSDRMTVTPGQRVLAYASGRKLNCTAWIALAFYDSADSFISHGPSSTGLPDLTPAATLIGPAAGTGQVFTFAVAPSNARFMRMQLLAKYEPKNSSDGRIARVEWYHPYVGIASEGQQTLPPWQP